MYFFGIYAFVSVCMFECVHVYECVRVCLYAYKRDLLQKQKRPTTEAKVCLYAYVCVRLCALNIF